MSDEWYQCPSCGSRGPVIDENFANETIDETYNRMRSNIRTTTSKARLEEALEHIQAIVNKESSVYKLAKQALEDK
jgi:predicted ArsR family transcriptional regulator